MSNISTLKDKKLFVLDMDGTFYLGDRIIHGSLDFIDWVRKSGQSFLFFTNNSSKNSEFYRRKLAGMDCLVENKDIITSGDVTINYINQVYPTKGVYLVGTSYLEDSFRQAGIKLTDENPDVVVIGFDTGFTYEKISKACNFIRNGSVFIATHLDLNCPTEDGFIPDCGAMCAMITASTGVKPKYLGKPFEETVNAILDITGLKKDDIAIVGDRLYTDIATGARNGVTSILVLSGETKIEDLEASEVKPDFIFNSLGEIASVLR